MVPDLGFSAIVSDLGFSAFVNNSFLVKQITYNPQKSILVVIIQTGISCEYHDVPLQIGTGFLKSKNKEKYFNIFIKDKYPERFSLLLSS
jgi:hypothetical protein